jgi:sugar phosphate isomerase/epimerase
MSCSALHGRATLGGLDADLCFLESLGLFAEIYLPAELLDSLGEKTVTSLLDWRERGRELTFHAPFVDLSPGGLDPKVLEVTRYRFSQVMDLIDKVRPSQVLFHPGFDEWRFGFRDDLWIENSLRVWSEVLRRAERSGVSVVLENVFDPRPDHLIRLRDRVGPELGFCFDTGHYLLFSEVALKDWFDAFGEGLRELHLHDNDGHRDLHLPVGDGVFEFRSLCLEVFSRDLEPVVVLEHHSRENTRKSLKNFQCFLEENFSDDGSDP